MERLFFFSLARLTRRDSHARDNKLHVWDRVDEPPASMRIGSTAGLVDLPVPSLRYSLDVNALNFCRFSLLRLDRDGAQGLVALPNLVESGVVSLGMLLRAGCD